MLGDVIKYRLLRGVLTRNLRRAYRSGEIRGAQYEKALYALKDDEFVGNVFKKSVKLRDETDAGDARPIIEWIQENWLEVVKIMLTLLLFVI
jgi:hypothetical protein